MPGLTNLIMSPSCQPSIQRKMFASSHTCLKNLFSLYLFLKSGLCHLVAQSVEDITFKHKASFTLCPIHTHTLKCFTQWTPQRMKTMLTHGEYVFFWLKTKEICTRGCLCVDAAPTLTCRCLGRAAWLCPGVTGTDAPLWSSAEIAPFHSPTHQVICRTTQTQRERERGGERTRGQQGSCCKKKGGEKRGE